MNMDAFKELVIFYLGMEKIGCKFLPVKRGGKEPAVLWRKDQNLWSAKKALKALHKNTHNIGIKLPDGFMCLDIDKEGIEAEIFKHPKWTLGPTLSVKTPNGRHYYLRTSIKDTKMIKTSGMGSGVDVFATTKAYLIGPGSINKNGKSYRIRSFKKIATLPLSMEKWITENRVTSKPVSISERKGIVKEGKRNDTLFRWAVMLHLKKVEPDTIKRLLILMNEMYMDPPLDRDEVVRIYSSAKEKFPSYRGYKKVYQTKPDSVRKDIQNRLDALGEKLRRNVRSDLIEVRNKETKKWDVLSDGTEKCLRCSLQDELLTLPFPNNRDHKKLGGLKYYKVSKADWDTYGLAVAETNKCDPFKIYLESLPEWDKTERLNVEELSKVFNIKGSMDVATWAFRSVLLACVWRAYRPGTKFDEVVILQGDEGIGKSTLWASLLPNEDWFSDNFDFSAQEKNTIEANFSKVIVEAAELKGTRKASLEALKAFISRTTDRVRFAYRRDVQPYPRRFVLVGTTNSIKPLPNDISGNRRFIVIPMEKKFETGQVGELSRHIKKNRKQYWAEALHLYKNGETAYLKDELRVVVKSQSETYRGGDETIENALEEALVFTQKQAEESLISGSFGFATKAKVPYITLKYLQDTLKIDGVTERKISDRYIFEFLRAKKWKSKVVKIRKNGKSIPKKVWVQKK